MSLSCHVTFPFSPYLFFLGAGRYVHGTPRTRLVLVVPVRWLVNDSETFSVCLAPWLRLSHLPMQLFLVICCHALLQGPSQSSGSIGTRVLWSSRFPFQTFRLNRIWVPFKIQSNRVFGRGEGRLGPRSTKSIRCTWRALFLLVDASCASNRCSTVRKS